MKEPLWALSLQGPEHRVRKRAAESKSPEDARGQLKTSKGRRSGIATLPGSPCEFVTKYCEKTPCSSCAF